ncbi:MAG: hypothetical protein PUG43_05440 [Clostridiales bacterium]|nr:hypothetical protein [Clostridiales bacterium]MDY4060759.1 hypothetical protein [Anaerovoracaceae bacterium]
MKLRYQILLGLALALAQGIISRFLGDTPFIPNAILLVTIVGVFSTDDAMRWVVIGWTATVLRDLGSSLYPGTMAMSLLLAVGMSVFLTGWISNENLFGVVINILSGITVYYSAFWVISYLAGSPYTYLYAAKIWALQIPFSIVFGLIAYHFITRSIKEKRRKERFRKYL